MRFLVGVVLLLGACSAAEPALDSQAKDIEKMEDWLREAREKDALAQGVAIIQEPNALQIETFGALAGLVGSRFRGTPMDGSTERLADIQHWQWMAGGTAILISHALEDGSYGGDTIIHKAEASRELTYVYITNAGVRTSGVIHLSDDGSYTAEEDVAGHPTITKVRSTRVINEDGSTSVTSEYLDGENWVRGHAFNYVPTDIPLPRLKPAYEVVRQDATAP